MNAIRAASVALLNQGVAADIEVAQPDSHSTTRRKKLLKGSSHAHAQPNTIRESRLLPPSPSSTPIHSRSLSLMKTNTLCSGAK